MINVNELTPDERRALARVKQLGGERVLEVIRNLSLKDVDHLKHAVEMPRVHRLQGRVEAFDDLAEAIETASQLDARDNRV